MKNLQKNNDSHITPLMEQYLAIKKRYKDAVLFFRMGDFFEMFYEDARIGSQVLGITLTSRAHGKAADVPLAGFPHHVLDVYLAKMIKAGYRVAVCEQIEDPKKARGIVKRDVVEVVTPGTAISEDLLETKRNNYLVSVSLGKNSCGLAVADISTGEFQVGEVEKSDLRERVEGLDPAEVLISDRDAVFVEELLHLSAGVTVTRREEWTFQYDYGYETLTDHFGTLSLKGFGLEELVDGICAAGAILCYLRENQKERLVHINRIALLQSAKYMVIDATTRRNLELLRSMSQDGKQGTLLSVIDRTRTPMGGRMLVNWLRYPLNDLAAIEERLDGVEELSNAVRLISELHEMLRGIGDLERLVARFATGRANARDARAIADSLQICAHVKKLLDAAESTLIARLRQGLDPLAPLAEKIQGAIVDNPPLSITDGNLIRPGFNTELDELRDISFSGKDWIARLQAQEREKTGITSLKVSYNKVFGYYIEVTKPNLHRVPSHYIRKQTLVNAERYITQELKEYEEKVLGAEDKMAALEYQLFDKLRQDILAQTEPLQINAGCLANLDCLVSLALVARDNDYHRPDLNDSDAIRLRDSRHPVVEKMIRAGEPFIANDVYLDNRENQILIITGPNMAGKSTYLRQIGLIVILAHMGSFVPAAEAHIGLVDRVFTRVGASDNLTAGESTFLHEMNETANILNNASSKSLVLLDEIGRGTSTYDGLSIAWSVVEYLHNTPKLAAKTVFATHYHELTELERILPRVKNYNVAVKEWGDHIVFLRKIIPGGCDHSYGIQVAKLAGLPAEVIARAKEILANLESETLNGNAMPKLAVHRQKSTAEVEQMNLFAELERKLQQELVKLDPNQLTPIEALNKLDELKNLAGRSK